MSSSGIPASGSGAGPPEPAAFPPPPRRPAGRWFALGCGLATALLAGAVLALLVSLKPYTRASDEVARVLRELLPPDAVVEGVRVAFPARVTIERLELAADPGRGRPALTMREITGHTVLASWLRQQPDLSLATRFWGGSVSLNALARHKLRPGADRLPPFVIRGTARDLQVEECVRWLNVEGAWRGRVDVDVAGQVDGVHVRASVVDLSWQGRELNVPELDFGDVVLPPNRRAMVRGQASYRDGVVEVTEFALSGTGYDLEGHVRVRLRDPVAASPLSGRVALRLKEEATFREGADNQQLAEMMMRFLIQSKGQLHAKLGGTVRKPEAELDENAILRGLLSNGS